MIRAGEIVDFLHEIGQTRVRSVDREFFQTEYIVGVARDTEATRGTLAWVSPNVLKEDPGRVKSFGGSLLVCPEETWADGEACPVFALPCAQPKMAFIEAVEKFFPGLTGITWPPIRTACLTPDAIIGGNVVLSPGVVIGSGTVIQDDVVVGPNTCIANTTVESGVRIGCNCSIGLPGFGFEKDQEGRYRRFPHVGRVWIQRDVEIGNNVCIDRGALGETIIGRGSKIDNLVHVAHNVVLGSNVVVIANSMIGGSTRIGNNAWVAPSASIINQIQIGADSVIGLGAVVLRSVGGGITVVGNPARPLSRE